MKDRKKKARRRERKISRRDFVSGVAASVAAVTIVPRHVFSRPGNTPASEKINLAFIGTGGQGIVNLKKLLNFPEIHVIEKPPKTLPISIGHHKEWIEACKGGRPAGSNFEFVSLLTEVVLLGNVALHAGEKLYWDGPNMMVTNVPEANAYLHRSYRKGWSL